MAANSYRNVFLTNLSTILSAGNTSIDAGLGELGIVDARTNVSTITPTFPTNRSIQVILGTTDNKLPKGMTWGNQTLRTPEIPADPNIKFDVLKGQKPQNMIVTLGYDGADTSKTMAPRTGKDLEVYLTLTGQPIANLTGNTGNHPAEITETFFIKLPCVSDCADDCSDTVNCTTVADAIIEQMSARKVIGGIQLVDGVDGNPGLIRITKLVTSCTNPSGLVTVDCQKYELLIADNGTGAALGAVEAQYPGYTVTRLSYEGIYSTYEMSVCPGGSAPSAYVENGGTVIPNCTTCPSGFNYVGEFNVYEITRTDVGSAANLTTVVANYGGLTPATSVRRLSYVNGLSTYQFYSTSALAVIQARATLVGLGDTVTAAGVVSDVCLGNSLNTTAWTAGDICNKATKNYQITLKDTVCGTSRLTELQAIYGSGVAQGTYNAETCTRTYTLAVLSDQACVDCGTEFYTWTLPAAYGGQPWVEVAGQDTTSEGCICGLRFESAYVQRDRKECYFQDVSYEVEPLFMYISTNNPDFRDYSTLCNDDETFPVTLVQTAKYAQGYGSQIADYVKQSNFYFNLPWFNDPAVRDAVGYELNVDLKGYYDQFTLTWRAPIASAGNFSGFGLSQFEEYEFTFFTPYGSGAALQAALNTWLSSVGAQPNHI